MNHVRILADDFTGALDAAAPFATFDAPVRLLLSRPDVATGKLTVSSESRDLPVAKSLAAVDRVHAWLGADAEIDAIKPGIWFKKVDSVLRGHSVAETLEMMRRGNFAACIFAPAFPEMGRRTRDGMHEVRGEGGWEPAAIHDLRAEFAAEGVEARVFMSQSPIEGIVIGDAVQQADLDRIVDRCRNLPNILWAGSRGLAQALASNFQNMPQPHLSAIIAGTIHPVTRTQVARAVAMGLGVKENYPVLIDPVPKARNAQETTAALMRDIPHLSIRPGSGLMVIGGDTLSAVLSASKAQSMECLGEIAPGLPVSRILGGQFDGVEVVTKSGGFGDDSLLERMIDG
ncbi:four-carbon acid sugar kinase family protein [Thalassospira alkalitolerans]|uniref:four-carbon acid sugar kinase family protein n=1 Tax=Thalassospira alkalitolerans TaxID=1293890 RepID=UPI0030EE1DCC|tara:strand:- start:21253 stop:22284 length:1032 start_codon:yes stop_codon:yes gene_type:complete